jgi:hypothetical protein
MGFCVALDKITIPLKEFLNMNSLSTHHTEEELLNHLEEAKQLVEIGALYTHYRNPFVKYKVLALSILEASQEVAITYQKQTEEASVPSIIWVRPLSSWLDKVQVGSSLVPRFQKSLSADTNLST